MAEDNQNTAPDPGKFNQAKEIAKQLAREMNDSAKAGRDLTAEVEKLTKKLYGTSEAAKEINKSFSTSIDLAGDIEDQIERVVKGSRGQVDVEKDLQKALQSKKTLQETELRLLQKAGLNQTQISRVKKGDLDLTDKGISKSLKLSKSEKDLLAKTTSRLKSNEKVNEGLVKQAALIMNANNFMIQGLEGVSKITDKLGLGFLSKPLSAGAAAAKKVALQGGSIKLQFAAAATAAQALVVQLMLAASVSAGLKFDESVANLRKDFGITRMEARRMRMEFTGLATDAGLTGGSFTSLLITSKDIGDAVANLNKQFKAGGANLRDDVVMEMARLGKLTNLSAESQANFARFINISGKNARSVTLEARRAVVNAEAESGLRLDINKTLDKAGKINGQISAQLGGNIVKLSSAVATARQFGMELEQVAKVGDSLLNFEQSISNELEAELLLGRQINLERARLAALTGDYETLTKEINANIGDFGDFTKLNVLQQRALAQSVGMTADELSNVLLEQENIEELAKEARRTGDTQLAKQLESLSAQEKFTAAVDKFKQLFVDIVGGPLGDLLSGLSMGLSLISSVVGFFRIGETSLLSYLATGLLLFKAFKMTQGVMRNMVKMSIALVGKEKTRNVLAMVGLGVRKADNKAKVRGNVLTRVGNRLGLTGLFRNIGKFVAKMFSSLPFPLNLAVGAIGLGIAGTLLAKFAKSGDDVFSGGGYGKRTLLAPEGAIRLNDKDTVIAGTKLYKGDDVISAPAGALNQDSSILEGLNNVVQAVTQNTMEARQRIPEGIFQKRGQNNGSIANEIITMDTIGSGTPQFK